MLMCPVDRLANFSSCSVMMAEQSAIWAVNIEKCTENDRWPPVIYSSERVVEINNTGVTGQSLPPKNDFEHARGLRNSADAVNLTYETYRQHITQNLG